VGDKILDANHGVKGGFAAAQRGPLTPWSASKQESPRDPGRTIDPAGSIEAVTITARRTADGRTPLSGLVNTESRVCGASALRCAAPGHEKVRGDGSK